MSNLDQLTKLAELKEKGILTEEEFQLEKAKILSGHKEQPTNPNPENNHNGILEDLSDIQTFGKDKPKKQKSGCFKLVFIAVIAFIIIIVVAAIFGENKSSTANPEEQTQQSQVPTKTVPGFTVKELESMYAENEVKTDEQLKNSPAQISGTVQSIDKDFTDSIVVQLRGENEYLPASMRMDKSEMERTIALKKGNKVIIQCQSVKYVVKSVAGYDCSFISIN